jgi:tetratricopeptide (TPR) repeat protein
MVELFIVTGAILVFRRQLRLLDPVVGGGVAAAALAPKTQSPQLKRMIEYADRLFAEKKWLAAEKAYLGVLKLDHKNAPAYTHLGIIYSAQHSTADAVECFEIAARLRPGGSTYQNLGLAYLDNGNYMKAIASLEKAVMMEASPSRYVSLAKAYSKIGDKAHAQTALERAADLEASRRTLVPLGEAYVAARRTDDAAAVRRRLKELPA